MDAGEVPATTPAGDAVTWLGHATVLVELASSRVLTDPLLTGRVAHLRRRGEAVAPDASTADLVLVSHTHLDHLHLPSLRRLGPGQPMVVPPGTARWLRRRGFEQVTDLPIGEELRFGALTVRAVPAEHRGGRGPHSRLDAPAQGYVVSGGGRTVYFAGDTDLMPAMADLGAIDVALLPIWGWGRTIGPGHLDPVRAVIAAETIDPGLVIPVHWGTFSPVRLRRGSPAWIDEPAHRLGALLEATPMRDRFVVCRPGQSLAVPGRSTAPG